MSRLTIYQWESSRASPWGANVARLAVVLGVAPVELYGANGGPGLRDLRRGAWLSQTAAAEIVQMNPASYETGLNPLPDPYEFWADAYGVTVEVVAAAAERSRAAAQ